MLEHDRALDIDFSDETYRGTVQITRLPLERPLGLDAVDLAIESGATDAGQIVLGADRAQHTVSLRSLAA